MATRSMVVNSPRSAHAAVQELYLQDIKPHTKRGAKGRITWETVNDHRRHQMRKFFHGPVLRDIAEQVWLIDEQRGVRVRYAPPAWKDLFREWFIEPTFEEYVVRSTGELKLRERRRSTEELSDDEFAVFLLQVQAFAVVDLGVEFTEWQEDGL